MAKVILDSGDTFVAASNVSIFGSTGAETVKVYDGVVATFDTSVERIEFTGASSAYTFKSTPTGVAVMSGTTVVANVANGNKLSFTDGSVSVVTGVANGAVTYTVGGGTVTTTAAALSALPGATINSAAAEKSTMTPGTSTGTTTGQTFTLTTSADQGSSFTGGSGNDTFNAILGVSGASSTFQVTDVIDGGAGTDTFKLTVQSGQTGGTAVAQVNTYTFGDPAGATDTIVVNYGAVTSTITTGAAANDVGAAFAAAINNAAGATIAVNTAGVVVVTAPVAGTALSAITFGATTDAADLPTTAFTTANTAGIDLTTAVAGPAVRVENMETVEVTNVGGALTLDAANFPTATTFVSKNSTGANTFNNIGTGDITVEGNDVVTNGAVNFSSSATDSVTDALVVNAKNGVNAGVLTSTNANDDWTSVTLNSTGGTATATTNANVFTSMDLAGGDTMQSLTVNATSSITTGVITGWDTTGATTANKGLITVTGAAAANLGALDAAVEDVVATSNTGGVTLTASTQTDFTFAGGSGNDVITTGAVLAAGGSIAAGAGTADRLVAGANNHIVEANGTMFTGFEQLQVSNTITVDMDHLSAGNTIDTIRLTTGGVVNDMTAAQALNVTVTTGGNSPTLTVKNSTTLGQVDTVKITANDGAAAVGTIALATPVLTGVEKLELVATDNITIAALTGATSLDTITLSGAGTIGITTGASMANTNQSINGSAATGVLTIVATAATAAIAITGGSAGDTITTANALSNVVNGGAGLDTITLGTGTQDVASSAIINADADIINAFTTTTDDFDYNGTLVNGTGAGNGIADTEVASATTIAGALATADAANDIVFIATTDIGAGAGGTAMDTLVAGFTAANVTALINTLLATDGALNGAIAGLDTVLSTTDAVLFQLSTDSDTFVFRVTNTDTSGTNTITSSEIALVGVFAGATDLVAADYM